MNKEERRDRAVMRRRHLATTRRNRKRGDRHDFRISVRQYLYA